MKYFVLWFHPSLWQISWYWACGYRNWYPHLHLDHVACSFDLRCRCSFRTIHDFFSWCKKMLLLELVSLNTLTLSEGDPLPSPWTSAYVYADLPRPTSCSRHHVDCQGLILSSSSFCYLGILTCSGKDSLDSAQHLPCQQQHFRKPSSHNHNSYIIVNLM